MDQNTPPEGMEEFLSASQPIANQASPDMNAPPPGMDEYLAPEINEQKFGGLGNEALTAAESAASMLSLTGSKHLENVVANKFNLPSLSTESQKAREAQNPISSTLGGIGGFAGLMAATGGFGGIGETGAIASGNLAAEAAAEAGAGAGLTGAELATSVNAARAAQLAKFTAMQRISAAAIKAGIETAVYSGANETAKMIFRDPEQTLGTAAANIGLSGLLGYGLGAIGGGAGELWASKFGPKIKTNLEAVNDAIDNPDAPTVATPEGSNEPISNAEAIKEFNPNAAEVLQSSDRLGIEPTEGMLDKDSVTGHIETELAKQNTIPGRMMNSKLENIDETLAGHGKDLLSEASPNSQAVDGKTIREDILDVRKKAHDALSARYDAEKPHFVAMELTPEAKAEAVASTLNNEYVKEFPDSPIAKQATQIADDISKLKNVNSVKLYRTGLNNDLEKAKTGSDGNIISILKSAKDALTALRERGIQESATAVAAEDGDPIAAETIARLRQLDSDYAIDKAETMQTGQALGVGNTKNIGALAAKLEKLNLKDESLAGKVFDPDNVEKTKFFKDTYPDQYEIARKAKLKEILEKSIDTSQGGREKFSVQRFMTQLNDKNMNPEPREMLFPGQAEKIHDIRTVQSNFPGPFNTSNTAAALGFFDKIGNNAIDFAKLGVTKAIPFVKDLVKSGDEASQIATAKLLSSGGTPANPSGFKSMMDYISQAIKGNNLINRTVDSLFEGAALPLSSHILQSDKDREKLDKNLQALQSNPSPLFDIHGDLGHYLPDHAAQAAQTASNAVNYLNSLRPGTTQPNPLDKPVEPTVIQKEAFNQALDIANQPLSILKSLKDGTITPIQIKHLQAIYPGLYQKISQKLTNGIIDSVHNEKNIPYHTKMGLSLFLGQPLDSTMTPQGIMAAQSQMQQAPMPQQQQMLRQGHHSSMKNIGKLATQDQTPQQARIQSRQNKL